MSQEVVPLAVILTVFLAPLALAPHLLFYFDITPKVALLLFGAAAALAFASRGLDSLLSFGGTRGGRWYAAAAGGTIVLAGITTIRSAHPALAWNGSTWRRMGGLTECAVVIAALLIAAYTVRSPGRVVWLMRSICAAGLLTSCYGIAQYFGWDPLLPKAAYQAGEGIFQIVRPPGTLGHSDYFAAFLLWPVFAGIGLLREDRRRASKLLGAAAATSGIIAIVLSGSRGAWLALIAGFCLLTAILRPSARTVLTATVIVALAGGAFYSSPSGERLRARAHWIGEDRTGGARLLLWRDGLRMAMTKPLTGFGLDTFAAEFPRYESEDLARAYPDFYHESPHNMFLDALTAEGVPGALLLMMVAVAGLWGGLKARDTSMLPALAATLIAHQFIVFTATTAFYFYLGAGILAGAGSQTFPLARVPPIPRRAVLACGLAVSAFFASMGYRLLAADSALATVDRHLEEGDIRGAANAYRKSRQLRGQGLAADLYFSRRWATVATSSSDTISQLYYGQLALDAARLATTSPEEQQNAWYNLAIFEASTNDAAATESSLRAAVAAAPVWYKPRWALANLLMQEGRLTEAETEARRALYLDGGKDAEVASTMNGILGSAARRP